MLSSNPTKTVLYCFLDLFCVPISLFFQRKLFTLSKEAKVERHWNLLCLNIPSAELLHELWLQKPSSLMQMHEPKGTYVL